MVAVSNKTSLSKCPQLESKDERYGAGFTGGGTHDPSRIDGGVLRG
jgi:hypothetical protein